MMVALLDSNGLIQAKNLFYRFGFCPGFWDWLSVEHAKGTLLWPAPFREDDSRLVFGG